MRDDYVEENTKAGTSHPDTLQGNDRNVNCFQFAHAKMYL